MKLIQTKDNLLLIDEEAEIKKGDIVLHNFGMEYELEIPCDIDNLRSNTRFKVIAYYPLTKEAEELDLPLLPPFEKDNIEKLAQSYLDSRFDLSYERTTWQKLHEETFAAGYKAAQSKGQYSLEDMKEAINLARRSSRLTLSSNDIIDFISTQQLPKEFIPEKMQIKCMESRCLIHTCDGKCKQLKTVTNSEGKQQLVGTWKY